MKKHVSYPKIGQFRNVITDINRMISFIGFDEDREPILDHSIPKPILTFKGTVKIHGTNCGVSYNSKEGIWAQSRNNIITVGKDNAGFALFVEKNKETFKLLIKDIIELYDIDTDIYTISIFGEWAGNGIQKGVGISELEKAMYIFGVKISKLGDPDFNSYWVDSSMLHSPDNRIFNVNDYETYSVDIDFNMPQLAQNKLVDITNAVEKECPISKTFGVENGIGEGVVWSCEYKGAVHRFKVKGEKHSSSKVKKTASVDVDKLNSIQEFVDYSVTENRFNQAVENIYGKGELDVKKLGDLIRWMINDIVTEEVDTLIESGLEPKNVNKYISSRVREMFFKVQSEY